ncbi:hypothetical protein PDJAM_G00075980 [Pangasius djambal]|uniref:Uncharacterized protein n=1 Tax=Pangasius djambal TaxID=1691987 RepID=A0ACC5Z2T4_9TELE|nr:hypothetical protein [Pangasius djambal]
MWATPSYSLIILLICLIKVGEIRAQCERPFVGENRVPTDESDQSIFPEGSILTFRCSIGYQPEQSGGSRSITCTGKQWTKLELQCKKKSCGSPGELSNGKYLTPNGILFGATAFAECNEGYLVVGPKSRNCVDNGWDQRAAVCEAVKCLPPPAIQNGNFHPVEDSYNYKDAVTYSCSAVITCDAPRIDQGERIEGKAPPYKYKDFVRYRCKKGYTMTGSDSLTCEVNGWDPSPPVCTGIEPCF